MQLKLVLLFTLTISFHLFATGITQKEGIFSQLEELIALNHQQLSLANTSTEKNILADPPQGVILRIAPFHLRAMLIHTPFYLIKMLDANDCNFPALLLLGLIKDSAGPLKSIWTTYNYNNTIYYSKISVVRFHELAYAKNCQYLKDTQALFTNENLLTTLKKITFTRPSTEAQCLEVLSGWKKNSYLPFLCKVDNERTTKSASGFYKATTLKLLDGELDSYKQQYIHSLCSPDTTPALFCSNYLASDFWKKIINGESSSFALKTKCKVSDKNALEKCRDKLLSTPTACQFLSTQDFDSHLPSPACDAESQTLKVAKLSSAYYDCPAKVENSHLTNVYRIIRHLTKADAVSTQSGLCYTPIYKTISELLLEYNERKNWPLNICFLNKALDRQECYPYIPGSSERLENSETVTVEKVLYKLKGTSSSLRCQIVDKKTYNPLLLEYGSGCFIVFDQKTCGATTCKKTIYLDKKIVDGIVYTKGDMPSYIGTSFKNEQNSFLSIMEKVYKFTNKSIYNFSELSYFLENSKLGIIHGIGCIEEIYPTEYRMRSINNCSPVSFIIDGKLDIGLGFKLSVRTAIDNIQEPRSVNWKNIFNAVSNYQNIHPLRTWTLYGISKK